MEAALIQDVRDAASMRRVAVARWCRARDRPRSLLRPLPPPLPRRAVDARHLVGHHLGRRPARLRRRISAARSTPGSAARSPTARSVAFPGQTSLQAGGERAGKRVRVTADDVLAIGELPLVKNVSPEFMQEFPIVYGNKQSSHLVRGVAASLRRDAQREAAGRRPVPRGRGRAAAPPRRVHRHARCSGSCSAAIPPVGETIRIGGQPFEIVGVMEEKVQLSNYNRPDKYCVFIPWTTMGGLSDNRYVGTFVWQAVSPMLEPKAQRQVREFLAKRYRYNPADERALNMFGSEKTNEITGGIVGGLKIVLTFIGVLTLAIGGVGIMNIMFVNVQERTREIGVRKALGAQAARDPAAVPARGARDDVRRRRRSASRCRGAWCGCSARGRFSPSCSTMRAASPTSTWCCRSSWS